MLSAFADFIKKEDLFSPADKLLLTVSGGVDSVAMCELLNKASVDFGIAHCNFKLRGKESDEDELFVEKLAEKYQVPFHSISFNTNSFAKKNKLSIQAAARELRYEWFEEIRLQFAYTYIATAHHQDDSIETFFINLIRGTGIAGLHGILPKQGCIIRPLLFTGKDDILAFAKKNKLRHREDSSNTSDKYLRNKIRQKIIPVLKELNPKISSTLLKDIDHLRDVEKIYRNEIGNKKQKILRIKKSTIYLSIARLKELEPLTAYLFEFLRPYGFNPSSVEEIVSSLGKISGKQFFSATHRLVHDRKDLIIQKKEALNPEKKSITIKKSQKKVETDELFLQLKQGPVGTFFSHSSKCAVLDFDKLSFPLKVRKWQQGDVFQPLGMKGKKKLSDFFIDRKLSIAEKENTWLLLSEEKIVWVIGQRIDDRFKVTDKTRKIYFAELTE
jgi:tRNA(Ile)-lysidine synthase